MLFPDIPQEYTGFHRKPRKFFIFPKLSGTLPERNFATGIDSTSHVSLS
jgi:hypothetical protein